MLLMTKHNLYEKVSFYDVIITPDVVFLVVQLTLLSEKIMTELLHSVFVIKRELENAKG